MSDRSKSMNKLQLNLDSSKSPGLNSPSSSHPNFEAQESGFLNVLILKYKLS